MAKYTAEEWVNSLAKAGFGLIIAIIMGTVFNSIFLGILAFTFFFYLPHPDEEAENEISGVIFSVFMMIVLGLAFFNSPLLGLGLDFGIEEMSFWPHYLLIILLGAAMIFRSVVYTKKAKGTIKSEQIPSGLITFGVVLLMIAFIWFFEPWKWNPTTIVFTGIWMVSYFAGAISSDIESRQMMGVIIIGTSFVIFTMGVGMQEVGSAVFGQWWPTFFQFGQQVFEPMAQAWTQATGGVSMGWELITNPMAFAQRIMSGQYQRDVSTGLAGAFGVEIEEMRVTPIYPYQPFQVILKLNNKGAFDAKNVRLSIIPGAASPSSTMEGLGFETPTDKSYVCRNVNTFTERLGYAIVNWGRLELGERMEALEEALIEGEPISECVYNWSDGGTPLVKEEFEKQDIEQIFYISDIGCKDIIDTKLKKRAIPLTAILQYDYSIYSSLNLEFMQEAEWDRLVKEQNLVTQQKKPSTFTNAPVQLNIDSLEQPIREDTRFFVGVYLRPAQADGDVIHIERVILEFPREFWQAGVPACQPFAGVKPEASEGKAVWELDGVENLTKPYLFYCSFQSMAGKLNGPTQTFLIKASANYTFLKRKNTVTKIEFGGGCCEKSDCPTIEGKQLVCTWKEATEPLKRTGECVTEAVPIVPGPPGLLGLELNQFCKYLVAETGQKCQHGWGGCTDKSECEGEGEYEAGEMRPMGCYDISSVGIGVNVCCFGDTGLEADKCKTAFEKFKTDQAAIIQSFRDSDYYEPIVVK